MKYCPKCKTRFPDDLRRCSRDGEALQAAAGDGPESTRGETSLLPVADLAEAEGALPGAAVLPEADSRLPEGDGPEGDGPEGDGLEGDGLEGDGLEGTGEIAEEIEDLIFKVCNRCRTSFGGDLEFCPEDGTRLQERSVIGRKTVFLDAGAGNGTGDGAGAALEGAPGLTVAFRKYCPGCKSHFPLHAMHCETCGSPLSIPTLGGSHGKPAGDEYSGLLIADKYRLIKSIGAGGFGSVYLAKHESLGKPFAVKLLQAQLSDITAFRDRFHEEALKLSRLEDENIVKVIDFGEWKGFQYMVTDYVEGKDLGALIYGEKMPPLRAAKIFRQVAAALAEAHSKRIVHLDLKPANILVSEKRGRDLVKVIDFGIAEIYSETRKKRQESVTGTCTYMSPEQWQRRSLDPRTDIYGFGVIFYECLAAQAPFRHHRVSDLEKAHCFKAPVPLRKIRPEVPAELERLVHRSLEKDPRNRIQSAEELEAALEKYIRATENLLARRLKLAAAAALLLAAIAGSIWGIGELRRDREPPAWQAWAACAADGAALVEAESTAEAKKYQTRAAEVTVEFAAQDERGVDHLRLTSGAWAKEMVVSGSEARVPLPLEVGSTSVAAQAFDAAGNGSGPVQLNFVRHPAPSFKARMDGLPRHTREKSVDLVIEEIEGAMAVVTCESGEDRTFEVAIERAEGGRFKVTGPGAPLEGAGPAAGGGVQGSRDQGTKDPVAGGAGTAEAAARGLRTDGPGTADGSAPEHGPLRLTIPLRQGENDISVRAKDILSGEALELPESRRIVHKDSRPLRLEAALKDPAEGLLKMEPTGEWLTSKNQVKVEVRVDEAATRLPKDAQVRCERSGRAPLASEWKGEDLESGRLEMAVDLEEGRNEISIAPLTDLCGNRSEPARLVIHRDSSPPEVQVRGGALKHYGARAPTLGFAATDRYPEPSGGAFRLVDLASGAEISEDAFTVKRAGGDAWELRFLDSKAVDEDGRHELSIQARDRIGNWSDPAAGKFIVLADHHPPRITVTSPEPSSAFKVGDALALAARIEDAFPEGLRVEAVALPSPQGASCGPFALKFNPVDRIWVASIPVNRVAETAQAVEKPEDIEKREDADKRNVIEKPQAFETIEPGFDLVVKAADEAGHESTATLSLRFGWEEGEKLRWDKDGSVLVFHDACPARGVPAFWLSRTEVSNAQYARFLKAEGRATARPRSPDWKDSGSLRAALDLPVRGISFAEMEAYARWAGLSLPGRDAWLVAAYWDRGAVRERKFPWAGDWPAGGRAPVWAGEKVGPTDVQGMPGTGDASSEAAGARGSLGATPLDVAHLLGNVWEVVVDRDTGKPVRVGGGFDTALKVFQLEDRYRKYVRGEPPEAQPLLPEDFKDNLGFRCALMKEEGAP